MGTDQNKEPELRVQEKKDGYPELPPQMKKFSMIIFLLIGIAIGAFIFANPFDIPFLPGGGEEKVAQVTGPSEEKEGTLWTCPMHPNVLEKNPGECPICGMKLVPTTGTGEKKTGKIPKKDKGKKILYWQAPMDPNYISDKPGKSPMGMDLVPVYADESTETDEEGAIRIDPVTIQNIGIRSEKVVKGTLTHPIRTVGIVDYNDKNIFLVTTKFDGWIEKVYVNYVAERVKKGQPLFEIYSPELVSTQQEYLTAFDYRESLAKSNFPDVVRKADELLKATRERLRYWDITERQIEELEKTRKVKRTLTVTSLVEGLVVKKMEATLEGMYVKPGMNLYRIADLSSVWVHADIFESEAPWIREGQKAEVELSYFPGEIFHGKILFIQPFLKEKTRTIKVCVELPNPKERLRPEMYVNVKLLPIVSRTALMVPENAVIQSGERNVVFIDLGEGRFRPQEVELGVEGERVFEVKSGLKEGQKVVVSAQFLLDSESNLQEAIRKMLSPGNMEEKPGMKH